MLDSLFSFYGKLEILPDDVKSRLGIKLSPVIPRYDLTQATGVYQPLEEMKSKEGLLFFFLANTRGLINAPDGRRADKFLSIRGQLNFSSLFLFQMTPDTPQIIAYGNPSSFKYTKANKINPFYEFRHDGYLFNISPDWQTIELFIVKGGANTIQANAKVFANGGYNERLEALRAAAKPYFNYWTV